MLAPSTARSSAAGVLDPSKIIFDWLLDHFMLDMISPISNGFSLHNIKNNGSPSKTSLPRDAACLSKVHLKLFALCRGLAMLLGWFNGHLMRSAQKVIKWYYWKVRMVWWCNTEFECLCARSILVSRGRQHVTTLYHDMLRRTCHRQLPKHRSRGPMLDLQLTLPVYNSKTSSYGYSECCSTANRIVVWPACRSLVLVTRSH